MSESIFLPFPTSRGELHSQLTVPFSTFKASSTASSDLSAILIFLSPFYKNISDYTGPN